MEILPWLAAVLLILLGIAGTVLPALPGPPLVFAGLLVLAWIDDFTRVGAVTLTLLGLVTATAWLIDVVATSLGAKRAGASTLAVVGAACGTVVGLFGGLPGLLIGPLAGASVGEYLSRRDACQAARAGVATWVGLLLAVVAKLALSFAMVAIFATAYFV